MQLRAIASLSIWLAACGGGEGGPGSPTDAPPVTPDAIALADGAVADAPLDDALDVDAPPAATCTGEPYDPCTDNTQCDSGNCHLFAGNGFQVCVTPCTPGDDTTCPVDKTGANGFCNNKGLCKPAEPNDCAAP